MRAYLNAEKIYRAAENFSGSSNYTEKKELLLNQQALQELGKLLPLFVQDGYFYDSLAYHTYFKIGVIQHFLGNFKQAKNNYQYAIDLRSKLPGVEDSLFFKPWLYKGLIYYTEGLVDSAATCYRNAESISNGYHLVLGESERLYNNLGILYHETGNFRQAKNYFEKAISILPEANPFYIELLTTYKSNLASALIRLEEYTKAGEIYKTMAPFNQNKNEILYNLATIKLNTGAFTEAINSFRQISYIPGKKVRVYAYTGLAFFRMGLNDSAKVYFDRAIEDNNFNKQTNKNTPLGLALQFKADMLASGKKYSQAIITYQAATEQFYPGLPHNAILDKNTIFTGVFSYINLFNTLAGMAASYQKLYQQEKKIPLLKEALNKYSAAFKLADYVEKTYDSDEARLFLNKIKYTVHDKPIAISLQLFELTQNKEYVEDAYNFDQQNKATILSLNVQENFLRTQVGFNSGLFTVESNLKSSITRLSLKAAQITDSDQLKQIGISISEYEIELSKVREKINDLPGYRTQKYAQAIPSINKVQQMLDVKMVLLSYHLSGTELVIFCISKDETSVYKQSISESFFKRIAFLKYSLNKNPAEQAYEGAPAATELYKVVIGAVWNKIRHADKLLIIPDDELNHLPFEVLQNENGGYLAEQFSIQYQYSTSLLSYSRSTFASHTVMAVAPFATMGSLLFTKLSYSKEEVEQVKGKILIDSSATKANFLQLANRYAILHLATHTIVNDTVPSKSLIAFYPVAGQPASESNLYLPEIYNLQLDSTQLVILSACETGAGPLSKGEGLLSLARAFTYAGCPNIIASLWKADDKSTAWIIQRFYFYLNDGVEKSMALHKAKLDYLYSPDIEKRFKTPNYWAHLVITGIPENNLHSFPWGWLITVIALFIGLLLIIRKWFQK
ncbi:MAG: CHAT domain-containing protein [Ferruginibacter sp.]